MTRATVRHLPPLAERQRRHKRALLLQRRIERMNAALRADAVAKGVNPAWVNQYASTTGMMHDFRAFTVAMRGGNRLARKRAKREGRSPFPPYKPPVMLMSEASVSNLHRAIREQGGIRETTPVHQGFGGFNDWPVAGDTVALSWSGTWTWGDAS